MKVLSYLFVAVISLALNFAFSLEGHAIDGGCDIEKDYCEFQVMYKTETPKPVNISETDQAAI